MKTQVTVLLLLAAGSVMAQRAEQEEGREPPTAADFIARLDQDRDGKVSASEFDGPADAFVQFDANGDGYLGEDEAPTGPPPRGRHGQQDGEQDQPPPRDQGNDRKRPEGTGFAARLDQDGDGMVSAGEFDGPADAFAQIDANGDGYVSEDEAPTGPPPRARNGEPESEPQERQQPPPRQGNDRERPEGGGFTARLDKDGDGVISASEFDGPAEHFTQLDANGDGYLGEDEAPSGPPPGRNR